jgi:hypothetical protein
MSFRSLGRHLHRPRDNLSSCYSRPLHNLVSMCVVDQAKCRCVGCMVWLLQQARISTFPTNDRANYGTPEIAGS